ncbi:putative intron HNH endonuclease [Cotonvirus japonicus]|uniref:Intron HNH endonuclease n=1 Tax=Cotonvirus japonicus TaxID=2811091 RepID=A0ABM7NS59_9VIRU|nr:putative intron HNH endonuclease [Cotonvirus japonicus]BCS82994.1 putative intron HNH endonuclease [Cotonvirus japonicus]
MSDNVSKEIWKKIKIKNMVEDCEISNYGLIRYTKTKKIKPRSIRSGYPNFIHTLIKNGKKSIHSTKIHKIVAETFVKNDDPTKTVVNHINGDKLDSRASNLEWTTGTGNAQHAADIGLTPKTIKGVIKYDLDTEEYIEGYESVLDASKKNNISDSSICTVASGKKNHTGGYGWLYIDDNPNNQDNVNLSKYKQIVGFPNYLINEEGKIYSLSYKRFMKFGINSEGCQTIQLCMADYKKNYLVHRLVASHFIKRKNKDHNSIRHIDGDKTNNSVKNLEWCYVAGVESPKINYDTPYYNPKTAIKQVKRKSISSGPKDLLTANPRNLSKKQREERKKLLEKKSGSKSNKLSQFKQKSSSTKSSSSKSSKTQSNSKSNKHKSSSKSNKHKSSSKSNKHKSSSKSGKSKLNESKSNKSNKKLSMEN